MPAYRIAAPCSASWDSMLGDDRIRHCPQCSLDVYNFSEMTSSEIAQLVKAHTGRLCARFYQRADGTMLAENCPVGAPTPIARPSLLATAALSALVTIAPANAAAVPQSPTSAASQINSVAQTLRIAVVDPVGGVIPGATISLLNPKTGERFEFTTDAYGELLSATIPAGSYDLTITHAGFATFVEKGLSAPANVTAILKIGALMGEVVIVSDHRNGLQRFFSKLHRVFQ